MLAISVPSMTKGAIPLLTRSLMGCIGTVSAFAYGWVSSTVMSCRRAKLVRHALKSSWSLSWFQGHNDDRSCQTDDPSLWPTKVISFQAVGSLYGIETVDFAAAPSQMPNDKKPDVQIFKYDICVR